LDRTIRRREMIKITPEIDAVAKKYPTVGSLSVGDFFISEDSLWIKHDSDNYCQIIGVMNEDSLDGLDSTEFVIPVDVEIKWKVRK
jgi:hypothetical protein